MIHDGGGIGAYYSGMDDYAQDFTIQAVANELGAFTIKDANANRYIGTPNANGEWNMSTTAAQCRIQRIETEGKSVYYIQAPFSYGYANASLRCLAYPREDVAGDFDVVSYAKNGKECHWDILTTEEALALEVQQIDDGGTLQPPTVYSVGGIHHSQEQRGINIIRHADGHVTKSVKR
jgi:hypothetical protein